VRPVTLRHAKSNIFFARGVLAVSAFSISIITPPLYAAQAASTGMKWPRLCH
jgi:hypothetical protein